MRFVEETEAAWSAEQLAAAEREIENQKREWEVNRLTALRKEEERRKGSIDEEAEMLTFSREDSTNQVRSRKLKKSRRGRPRAISHSKRDSVRLDDEVNKRDGKRVRSESNEMEEEIHRSPVRRTKRNSIRTDDETTISRVKIDDKVRSKRGRFKSVSQSEDDVSKNDDIDDKLGELGDGIEKLDNLTDDKTDDSLSKVEESKIDDKIIKRRTRRKTLPNENEIPDLDIKHEIEVTQNNSVDEIVEKLLTPIPKKNSLSEEMTAKLRKISTPIEVVPAEKINNHVQPQPKNNHVTESESDVESDISDDSDNLPLKSPQIIANKVDADSPRTRSRGTVKINLWTLDVSPILPGVKPIIRSNTPLPKVKEKSTVKPKIKPDNGKIKNFKPIFDKERDGNIIVCPETANEKDLIQNCIKSELAVLVTDIATSDTPTLVNTSLNSSNSELKVTDSPKKVFRKPRILKIKKPQKQTLDKWLNKVVPSEPKRRKNSDGDSEPPKKLSKTLDDLEDNIVNDTDTPKRSIKLRKRCESDSETTKSRRIRKLLRKNSVSDSETSKKTISEDDDSDTETNRKIFQSLNVIANKNSDIKLLGNSGFSETDSDILNDTGKSNDIDRGEVSESDILSPDKVQETQKPTNSVAKLNRVLNSSELVNSDLPELDDIEKNLAELSNCVDETKTDLNESNRVTRSTKVDQVNKKVKSLDKFDSTNGSIT